MTVYLVGAGPGDPGLLTRRAAELLARADVVVVDRLVDRRILSEVPVTARVIDVGKHPRNGGASVSQESINQMLLEHSQLSDCVVRLKGGDPFLFGRGGEELETLRAAGVACEVVPGVSSAFGLPALAGIPVTHRGTASMVTVVSGHDRDGAVCFKELPDTGTVILMMAVENRAQIAQQLIDGGRAPSTSVAVIESGSTLRERRRLTTLAQLGELEVTAPAIMVVGEVAARLETL